MNNASMDNVASGLDEIYYQMVFLEEVAWAQAEKNGANPPLSPKGWHGMYLVILGLRGFMEDLKTQADALRASGQ